MLYGSTIIYHILVALFVFIPFVPDLGSNILTWKFLIASGSSAVAPIPSLKIGSLQPGWRLYLNAQWVVPN